MCPLSLDWYADPVTAPSGHSFSRASIIESLQHDKRDPITREPLIESQLYPNRALRSIVHHYRLHHQRFSILD